jgi:hypothetical protein
VNVAPLPPASPVPTQQPATPGAAALPGISSGKAAAANAPAPHNIAVAEGAIVPGVFLAGFRVKDVTSNSATISFPVGQGVAPQHLVVRYRKIHPAEKGADPEKAPREEWIPFKGWKGKLIRSTDSSGERIDSTIEIRLSGLLPGASNDIDLIGPPESDGVRPILHQAEIFTPPAEVTLLPRKPWFWGGVAAVLGVACFLQRRAR